MIQNLGQTIRNLRKQKNITLNDFAEKLNISAGYLSNLETAKTDTISLQLLVKLNEELDLFPSLNQTSSPYHELHFRLDRMCQLLKSLHDTDPKLANYFISHIEEGLELFKQKQIP
ncbi:helix-turn-helix domain-containing protein [Bacillus paranthracis]|uniref:helix-turn-helix domain-containing protein n=1 Tax=Bacillus cereus group TaxID=86661 RepID=UPI0003108E58|nr:MULTISPECIES: helix-turn-helix transcriptional regulator [Bacillus cereus group]MBY5227590.1 XRE family transcriptional regulator [Bacillus paranthracis]MCY9249716.1 helix-turn-helix domain-containing protein [Bacillus paranthracis]MDA1499638.1 helix-turn-helix transcriptional regulator [Bacillus cereus group sp. TH41-1LC]MDA1661235.1 helix-turn-helix transcriptional regulator [Bacillus cereus group sp. TH153LC]MDA1929577.1 helix-turn-helix transcriptional regulator [Bacillus cereus group s